MKDRTYKRKLNKQFFPNILTILNMFLGFIAIVLIMQGEYYNAGVLVLLAGLMDIFDGKIARILGISSKFGLEFDSLADTVSFCVVPAVLVYALYVDGLSPLLSVSFSFIPLVFGTIRLAKYNLDASDDGTKNYFVGLSTPIAAITLFSYMLFNNQIWGDEQYGDPRTALILVVLLGLLMVSNIHFPKAPLITFRSGITNSLLLLAFIFCAVALVIWKGFVLLPICMTYIIWNIVLWMIKSHHQAIKPGHIDKTNYLGD